MALFFCRRSVREPAKKRTPRFTVREIEPFITVKYRDDAQEGNTVVAVIGAAVQKADGSWRVHELSDEADVRVRHESASPEIAERLRNKPVLEMKSRLVDALNRLREHYGRVYVYPMKP